MPLRHTTLIKQPINLGCFSMSGNLYSVAMSITKRYLTSLFSIRS